MRSSVKPSWRTKLSFHKAKAGSSPSGLGRAFAAFEQVLVCEDCNNADTHAKKHLGVPDFFSFTIRQIPQFITPADHASHQVDLVKAQKVWDDAKPAFELRMSLIRAVAHATVTDSHWYEPHPHGFIPIPLVGTVDHRLGSSYVGRWVNIEAMIKALGPQEKLHDRNLARWRTTTTKPGPKPPDNYLALLMSMDHMVPTWNSLAEDWRCPCCNRSKFDQIYMRDKGKVQFGATTTSKSWNRIKICGDCKSTLMSLKLEVSTFVGGEVGDSYGFISPAELAEIVRGRPHSKHLIRAKVAAALFEVAAERVASREADWNDEDVFM